MPHPLPVLRVSRQIPCQIRLEPGTTKNDEGRTFVMTPELRASLEAQRVATEGLQRKNRRIIP